MGDAILPFYENVVPSKISLKVSERLFHNPQSVLNWAYDGYCVILIQRLNLTAFAVKHMEHPWKPWQKAKVRATFDKWTKASKRDEYLDTNKMI